MKILLTGGAGYVGSACLRHLAKQGHEVVAYDNLVEGHPKAVGGSPLVVGDILDTKLLAQTLKDFGAEAVMHFAAATNVGLSVEDPEYHYRTNTVGSLSLLEAMREANVKKMLFSSTSSTYGLTRRDIMDEDTPQAPFSPYARSKMSVEWMIDDYSTAYGLDYTLLRYFNACGADPSGEFGEYHDPETHIIPLLLEVALGKREKFVIFGDDYPTPDGTCVRDYVHIEDLANAHRLAIEATTKGTKGVFNIGIGNGQTVLEVIKACERVTGKSLATEMGTRRAGDPVALVSDPAKLRRVLGWEPQYKTIDSIVETAWAWHQANPDGYTGPRFPDA